MALNMNKVNLGVVQSLNEFGEPKNYRRSPKVWVAYVNDDGEDCYVEVCAYGARTLAKGLTEMANIAEPPPKPRKRRS